MAAGPWQVRTGRREMLVAQAGVQNRAPLEGGRRGPPRAVFAVRHDRGPVRRLAPVGLGDCAAGSRVRSDAPRLPVPRLLVATLTCNWTINNARDLAWNNARLLWPARDDPL